MGGVRLADGLIALATTANGILFMDVEGRVKNVINKKVGLADNEVLALYVDSENGLWAGLNKGLSRVEYPSPVTWFNESANLEGIVHAILSKDQWLYVGTSSGLFVKNEADPMPQFSRIPKIRDEVWNLVLLGDSVLVGSSTGVFLLSGHKARLVVAAPDREVFYSVLPSKTFPDALFVGMSNGLGLILKDKDKWCWMGKTGNVSHEVSCLAESPDGSLWAGGYSAMSRLNFHRGLENSPQIKEMGPAEGFTEEVKGFQIKPYGGRLLFGTSKGLFSFEEQDQKLVPDSVLGAAFVTGNREAINLAEDPDGGIWLTSEFRTGRVDLSQNSPPSWDTIPLSRLPKVDIWTIYPDSQERVWLGSTEGLYCFSSNIPKDYRHTGFALIRKVYIDEDSVLFHGAFSEEAEILWHQPPSFAPVLAFPYNAIGFEFAASSFEAPDQLRYSYLLEGSRQGWSQWTSETRKEFSGLPEGTYAFKVKYRNVYGAESPVSAYSFQVLPPLHRTWWAYGLYLFLFVLLMFAIVKINVWRLLLAKKNLERVIEERTHELAEEKKKSDDLLLNILPAEMADELKAHGKAQARRFEQVTVLFTDFKGFTQISENLSPEELVAIIDYCFSAFDGIISNYGIEKIKTIGDSYVRAEDSEAPAKVPRRRWCGPPLTSFRL